MAEWELGTGLVWVLAALWAVTRLPSPSDARPARAPGPLPTARAVLDTAPDTRARAGWPPGSGPAPRAAPPGRRPAPLPASP